MKEIISIYLTKGQIAKLKPLFDAVNRQFTDDPENPGSLFAQPWRGYNGWMEVGYLEPAVAKKIAKILKKYYTPEARS